MLDSSSNTHQASYIVLTLGMTEATSWIIKVYLHMGGTWVKECDDDDDDGNKHFTSMKSHGNRMMMMII